LKNTEFTFSPTETGAVTLTVECTTNSIYIYSIAITEEEEATSEPSISASDVDINFDATSGEISYTLNNPVEGAELTASSETDWISNVTVDAANNKVTFSTTTNNNAVDREGTITLTYKNGNDVLDTKNVTVTQGKAVVTYHYSLATAVTPGKHYIITNGSSAAMGANRGNNHGSVDISIAEGKTSVLSDAGVCEVLICGDVETGYYKLLDEAEEKYLSAASSSSNNMKYVSTVDNNAKWSIKIDKNGVATIKSQGSYSHNTIRYNRVNNPPLFSCYASGQSDIYLFERDGDEGVQNVPVTIAEACTDGSKYYGTYSCPFAFIAPSDVTVSEISVIDDELLVEDYEPGDVVPANTGVMISSSSAGSKTLTLNVGGTSVLGTDNMLKPSSEAMTGDCLFYRLTMHNGTQIGFWWGAAEGAAFDIAANKAYLAVPTAQARMGFAFADEATGIEAVQTSSNEARGEVYNLQGQRVKKAQKGLYIVNGKKFINK